MKKQKIIKVLFAVFSCLIVLSSLVIPCFAEYNGEWSKSYPFLNYDYLYVNDYSSFVNGTVQGSLFNVDYLSRYRYFYYNGGSYKGDSAFCEYFLSDTVVNSAYNITYGPSGGDYYRYALVYPSSLIPRFLVMLDDEDHTVVDLSRKSSSDYWNYFFFVEFDNISADSLDDLDVDDILSISLNLSFYNSRVDYNVISGDYQFYSTGGTGSIVYYLYMNDSTYNSFDPEIHNHGFSQSNSYDGVINTCDIVALTVAYSSDSVCDMYACNSTANPNYAISVVQVNSPLTPDPQTPEEEAVSVLGAMRDFVFSMFMAPSVFLSSMLDFNVFGINLYTFIKVILTLCLVAFVVGLVVKLVLHLR